MCALKLVVCGNRPEPHKDAVYVGRRYSLAEDVALDHARRVSADTDLLVGGYRVTPQRAQVLTADPERHPRRLFVWDSEATGHELHGLLAVPDGDGRALPHPPRLRGNRLQLLDARLDGPRLMEHGGHWQLCLEAVFELAWHSSVAAARLAAVELVQARRSLHFADGGEQLLLDTATSNGPVRHGDGDAALRFLGPRQDAGAASRPLHTVALRQAIPERTDGREVASVTVLEQYSTHFLQCADPQDPDNHIWVPLLGPVAWGWSIRVGRRTDGEWGILRRKLFLPAAAGELCLPEWQACTGQLHGAL